MTTFKITELQFVKHSFFGCFKKIVSNNLKQTEDNKFNNDSIQNISNKTMFCIIGTQTNLTFSHVSNLYIYFDNCSLMGSLLPGVKVAAF